MLPIQLLKNAVLQNKQGSEYKASTPIRRVIACAASAALMTLSACGGGGTPTVLGGAVPTPTPAPAPTPSPAPAPAPTPAPAPVASTCLDGLVANIVGVDDPFYVNSWHLENTGPTQVVSASTNNGVAGIDANVKAVHLGGKGCTGKGVIIAIVDSGLELAHEDLVGNVVSGGSFKFSDNTSDPTPTAAAAAAGQDHGTGVAGVAAATGWNGKGSRGMAPFASVVAYDLIGPAAKPSPGNDVAKNVAYLSFGAQGDADQTIEATAIFGARADKVSIFNFSAGGDSAAAASPGSASASHEASKLGTKKLRSGLGAVYFQSAGNAYTALNGQLPDGSQLAVSCGDVLLADTGGAGPLSGSVFSNLAGQTCGSPNQDPNDKPYFYQVAAIHNTGLASSYSSAGASNWITGFGGEFGTTQAALISTDNSGCTKGGNNTLLQNAFVNSFTIVGDAIKAIADLFGASLKDPQCNYTGQMNGTSAAAPSVSGIAALMLEVNPKLTWQDVGFILAKTARKVDTGIATSGRATTFTASGASSAIDLDKPWQTNSAGFNFQNRYGFGLIDAAAATSLARGFATPAGRRATDVIATGGASTSADFGGGRYTANSAIVAFAPGSNVTGQMQVELEVTNSSGAAANPGMIQIEMKNNTTGQVSILMPAFTSWYRGGKNFPLANNGKQTFRTQTNAFYGDKLSDGFTVTATYVKPAGQTGGTLSFTPVLTSFSL